MFRALSYNIHKGFNTGNRRYVLGQMRQALHAVEADVVFLQEVRGNLSPKFHADDHERCQISFLAGSKWPHFAYGKNAITAGGNHGNGILSKFPIKFWENIDISTYGLERRGLLHVVLDYPPGEEMHLICLHLNLFHRGRIKQIRKVQQRILECVPQESPLLVAGDFNDWQAQLTPELRHLRLKEVHREHHGDHARSFPSWAPIFKLDRIYHRGFKTHKAQALTQSPWRQLSDHAPLYSELQRVV